MIHSMFLTKFAELSCATSTVRSVSGTKRSWKKDADYSTGIGNFIESH
jgi:hypothetical protein